jgi:N-acetyl-anhydromuramyl-L-alanine amidase AmpD
MSNSSLVNYTKLSPNYSSRNGQKISRITPHHMSGNLSVETCGSVFSNGGREASSNYGIGSDGRVGMYVEEKNRAWTSSNRDNDQKAITIEVANSKMGGNWPVSDKAYAKLIDLCVDICRRYGKNKLLYLGSRDKTLSYTPKSNEMVLTMHQWFASTDCPGPYLKSKFPDLAEQVTKRLSGSSSSAATSSKDKAPSKLTVDGKFYSNSVKRLQWWLDTVQDGEISGQKESSKKYIPAMAAACTWDGGGSQCIKALQKHLARKNYAPGTIDGICGKKTVKALQKFLRAEGYDPGTIDGILGTKSAKALQRFLNARTATI